jgi:hypothetical protein
MAAIVHNVAKGSIRVYADNVNNNTPSTSGFIWIPVLAAGLETDATLRDKTTVSAYFSGATDEATGSNWNRKTWTDTSGIVVTVDQSGDLVSIDGPDLVWSPGPTAGNSGKLLVAYYPDVAGADTTGIPLASYDFAVTVDGTQVTYQMNAAGFLQAT